jgi:hypothetical protein
MLDDIAGAYGSRFLLAAGGVGIALLCLLGILWVMRNRPPSPFVRGGRNRQPRLQVLDAAAVDARRRLVLVRRDEVEHLIMIGGPTDLVIETGIGELPKTTVLPAPSYETLAAPQQAAPPASSSPLPQKAVAAAAPALAVVSTPDEPPRPPARHEAEPRRAETPAEIYSPSPANYRTRAHFEPVAAAEAPLRSIPPVSAEPARQQAAERPRIAPIPSGQSVEVPAPASRMAPEPERHLEHMPQVTTSPAQSMPTVADEAPVSPQDAAPRPTQPAGRQHEALATAAPIVRPNQPRELGSDFQSILEAEMSNNLTAERIIQNPSAPGQRPAPQPLPGQRREPEMEAVPTGDAALQTEVARIFGEMSVNRDK